MPAAEGRAGVAVVGTGADATVSGAGSRAASALRTFVPAPSLGREFTVSGCCCADMFAGAGEVERVGELSMFGGSYGISWCNALSGFHE